MRVCFILLCISVLTNAVGVARQHAASLGPSLVFATAGLSLGDDGCGVTCLPASPSGSVCKPLQSDYPCGLCHQDGDPAGCCFVSGYYPSLCSAASSSLDCLQEADTQAQARSEVCTTVVTCSPACGNVTQTLTDPTGAEIVLCTYDTCAGQTGCPAPPPPAVCEMGPWSTWTGCLQPTGVPVDCTHKSGLQYRTRDALTPDACYDAVDNPTMQSVSCTIPVTSCLVNCVQSAYTAYTMCPKCWNRYTSNSPPTAYNSSVVTTVGLVPGKVCDCPQTSPSNTKLCLKPIVCNTIPYCPRDCVPSAWSSWTQCDKSCADYQNGVCQTCTGLQNRTRTIVTTAEYGGIQCGPLVQEQNCNTQQCPIDCLMSTWSTWSDCTAECGGGQQQRTRYSLVAAQFGGAPCGQALQIQVCGTAPCPVSCVVGDWTPWDRTCPACVSDVNGNPGSQTRTRSVTQPAANGGATCPPTSQVVPCPYNYCPVDCVFGAWSSWTTCSVSCGGGVQSREREISTAARFGGAACVGPLDQQRPCSTACCAVDCVWYWSVWSNPNNSSQDCSVRCGGGTQTRSVVVVVPSACGGKQCGTGNPADQTQVCNTRPCSVDCVVTDYDKTVEDCIHVTKPAYCSATCGLGWCVRNRNISVYPQFGGAMCPLLEDWIQCNPGQCTTPCQYSPWGSWSQCSATCGAVGQQKTRSRTLLNPSMVGDTQCVDLNQNTACEYNPCPQDCVVGSWSSWSPCPVSCGLGSILRTRSTQDPLNGGAPCPYAVDINYCDAGDCPVTCVVSDWSDWSPCPVTCVSSNQNYYRTRNRVILRNGTNGCSYDLEDTEPIPCVSAACPSNCVLSDWGSWSACVGCDLQQQTRTRNITQAPANGGRLCQVTTDTRFCQGPPCPVPCTFSPWSLWGPCSVSCAQGTQSRTRYLVQYDQDASSCPTLVHTQPCVEQDCCPVDCTFSFSDWTPCSPQGYRRRFVQILTNAQCSGVPCPTCRVERDDCTPPEDNSCWLEDCPDA